MEELNAERIIDIHDDIIREYGGTDGLLTQGTLELLIYKVNREKDVFKMAAFILYTIAAQHPFFDGNKRTAFVTAENVLGEAGYYGDADDDEIVELMRKIAEYKHTVITIELSFVSVLALFPLSFLLFLQADSILQIDHEVFFLGFSLQESIGFYPI